MCCRRAPLASKSTGNQLLSLVTDDGLVIDIGSHPTAVLDALVSRGLVPDPFHPSQHDREESR